MKRFVGRRGRRVAVMCLVVLGVAAGAAYATIPDANKVYTGCMLRNVGTLRLIDASLPKSSLMSHCTASNT